MITFLMILVTHIIEAIGVALYILIKKQRKLTEIISKQQIALQNVSDIIEYSNIKLQEIDATGAFRSDDEVGFFFQGLQEIQQTLNNYTL